MIVCPVCEHPQAQGTECDNCGKQLAPPRAQAAPVAPLPELQQTRVVAAGLNVTVEPMTELEATRMKGGPDLPVQRVADLELTAAPPVAAVPSAPMPDFDAGRAADDGQRTQAPTGAVTCRYCRNVQASGLLCERCGMRLPRAATPAATTRAAAGEEGWTVCTDCGTRALIGRLCPNCGTRVEAPE